MAKPKIFFTKHGKERMEKRGVTKEQVKDTVLNPSYKKPIGRDNTQEYRREVGKKEIFVVVGYDKKKNMTIITTGWVK